MCVTNRPNEAVPVAVVVVAVAAVIVNVCACMCVCVLCVPTREHELSQCLCHVLRVQMNTSTDKFVFFFHVDHGQFSWLSGCLRWA